MNIKDNVIFDLYDTTVFVTMSMIIMSVRGWLQEEQNDDDKPSTQ